MNVKMLTNSLIILSTSIILSGCCKNTIVKPTKPDIEPAKIGQCRSVSQLDNVKCVLTNYMNVKEERDKLRLAIDKITE
jgi:hypothetical protein